MNQLSKEKSMRERMLAGEPYIASDPELGKMHLRAQRILHVFNISLPDATEERQSLIHELFGALGADYEVKPPFRCDYGSHIVAGERLFINYDCVILDCNTVRLGDRVLCCLKHGWEKRGIKNPDTEKLMQQLEQPYEGAEMKPLYTAVVTVTPGQEGHARMSGHAESEDGLLALELAMPQELGGRGQGTNPEQLFAAGYAACFHGALALVARKMRVDASKATVTNF